MFMKYEKSFKIILNYYYTTGNRTTSSKMFSIPRKEIDYLAAKGLLIIVPYVNGDPDCRITISDRGLLYFDEKYDKLFRFWIPVSISIIALIRPEIVAFIKWIVENK